MSMKWQTLRPRPFSRALAVPGLDLMMLSRRNWPILRFVIRIFGQPGVRTPPPQAKSCFRFQWTLRYWIYRFYWAFIVCSICLDRRFRCRTKPVGKVKKYTRIADTELGVLHGDQSRFFFIFPPLGAAEQSSVRRRLIGRAKSETGKLSFCCFNFIHWSNHLIAGSTNLPMITVVGLSMG